MVVTFINSKVRGQRKGKTVARYGQSFKSKAVARLLPPESAAVELVALQVGVGAGTLGRWQAELLSGPARGRAQTAATRLDAVITTASMNETAKSAWCREQGVYAAELAQWLASATASLVDPSKASVRAQAKPQESRRIKELERNLLRKDRALAETLALLVLSKKVDAIFNKGEDA